MHTVTICLISYGGRPAPTAPYPARVEEDVTTVSYTHLDVYKRQAKILYSIYFVMTVIQILLLLVGGMPLFDSICTAFGTAGTGGFGIKNDSMASYSTYLQVVITVFMILFCVNFNAYFFIITKKFAQAFKMEEVRYYFGIIGIAILIITCNIYHIFGSAAKAFQQAAFQGVSMITTTGYATTDFNTWPEISRTILVLLMFIGACAGSTGGGIKVSRILILCKTVRKELHIFLHPNAVKKIKMDGKAIPHEVVRSTNCLLYTSDNLVRYGILVASRKYGKFAIFGNLCKVRPLNLFRTSVSLHICTI